MNKIEGDEYSGVAFYKPMEIDARAALHIRYAMSNWAERRPDLVKKRLAWKGCAAERVQLLTVQLPGLLANADPVIWRSEILTAAMAGQESFVGGEFRADIAPLRPQLWFLGGQIHAAVSADREFFEVPENAECDMVLLQKVAGADARKLMENVGRKSYDPDMLTGRYGLGVCLIFTPMYENVELMQSPEEAQCYYRFLPPLYEGEAVHAPYAAPLAALTFLGLPFVEQEIEYPYPLTRQQRRACARKGVEPPQVRCVVLRRRKEQEGEARDEQGTQSGGSRDWSCRWLVGAHWRRRSARWSKGEGPIFVSPYLKGPSDKEFRAPRKTVFLAER